MKKLTFLILLTFFMQSCIFDKEGKEQFIVEIDRFECPDSLAVGDTLVVGLWGWIGADGHYAFSHIDLDKDDSKAEITAYGTYDESLQTVTMATVQLSGYTVTIEPPFEFPFQLRVYQDKTSYIGKTIYGK